MVGADGVASLESWLAAQPPSASRSCSTTRGRAGDALALAVVGTDGRVVAAEGRGVRCAAAPPSAAADPSGRPRGQAGPRGGLAEDPAAEPLPVAFDTQIAAYILNAALRSQTIADVVAEHLDQILPPATSCPRRPARARGAVGDGGPPLQRRLDRYRGPRAAVPRGRAAADPGPRPDGGRRRRARPRGAGGPRSRVRGGDHAARAGIYTDVGHEFNLGSPKQLEQVLFFELNLPKGKRTKTGFSTDASVLEEPARRTR